MTLPDNELLNSSINPSHSVRFLPNEIFVMGLDSHEGIVNIPSTVAATIIVTNFRVIHQSSESEKKIFSWLDIDHISSIEVSENFSGKRRLNQSLVALGAGIVLGGLAWLIFTQLLFVLLLGGLPILAGIHLLSGYIFQEEPGELVIHSDKYSMRIPLSNKVSCQAAYEVANRIGELSHKTDLKSNTIDELVPENTHPEEVQSVNDSLNENVDQPLNSVPINKNEPWSYGEIRKAFIAYGIMLDKSGSSPGPNGEFLTSLGFQDPRKISQSLASSLDFDRLLDRKMAVDLAMPLELYVWSQLSQRPEKSVRYHMRAISTFLSSKGLNCVNDYPPLPKIGQNLREVIESVWAGRDLIIDY